MRMMIMSLLHTNSVAYIYIYHTSSILLVLLLLLLNDDVMLPRALTQLLNFTKMVIGGGAT